MSTTPLLPVRPPLVRPRSGRMVGGVAVGVADHLGLPPKAVRIGFVAATVAGGAGAVLYAWLWALAPASSARATAAADAGADAEEARGHRPDLVAGALLLGGGLLLLLSHLGLTVGPGVLVPLLVVGAGAVLAYTQFDEVERARWVARAGVGTGRTALLRMAGGVGLVVVGILLLVVQQADIGTLGSTLLAALSVLAGAGLVLAPWGVRMWRDLDEERSARVRESARADIAAHLHDSVLQTLALIQRRSHDPAEVARLARAQERDLRGWLYGGAGGDPTTLAARVAALAAEVEDNYGTVVEVVTVGDRPADEALQPLLAALREAVVNAAKHSGTPVQVYVEAGPDGVEVNVRDRGEGFDPGTVPEDRLGVRESIIGRMERHGGSARVRSEPGEGTEVRLLLPERQEVES